MTRSDKAREIVRQLNNDLLGIDDDGDPFLFKLEAAEVIAAALREVEAAAYERAAQVADKCDDPGGRNDGAWIAREIRALKKEA